MRSAPFSIEVPYSTPVVMDNGMVSRPWAKFFENIQTAMDSLGIEKQFDLVNNQASSADVEGLMVDKSVASNASVDYLIQRVTTGGGATENVETGTFYLAYKPSAATWVLSAGPSTAGVTLSVTSLGQVKYTTTNISGTASISRIVWRVRTLGAKNAQYSRMGR